MLNHAILLKHLFYFEHKVEFHAKMLLFDGVILLYAVNIYFSYWLINKTLIDQ